MAKLFKWVPGLSQPNTHPDRFKVTSGGVMNVEVLPKVGRKSATASPKHKSLIVALMLNLGWSAPLLAIHC